MNPKKNKLWKEMKDLVKKYYNKINFERVKGNKFVEDNDELTIIGLEIVSILKKHIKSDKLFFTDICGAPGNYSKIILKNFKGTGIGISLDPEKGGVPFEIDDNSNYKIFYRDILQKNYKLELPKKLSFGIASCVSYQIKNNNAFQLNLKLIITSLLLILKNLDENGSLVINMTMKNINFAFNLVFILSKLFKTSSIWKSKNVWADKNTFYFFGFEYSENQIYIDKLEEILLILENNNFMKNIYFRKILMNYNNFKIIDKMMSKLYQVKINEFKKYNN